MQIIGRSEMQKQKWKTTQLDEYTQVCICYTSR